MCELQVLTSSCRYEKRHSNLAVHVSPCFRVAEGDIVTCGQCRYPLQTLHALAVVLVVEQCFIADSPGDCNTVSFYVSKAHEQAR